MTVLDNRAPLVLRRSAGHLDQYLEYMTEVFGVVESALIQDAYLTEDQFKSISELVHGLCGINLHSGKKELVKARLTKRLRVLGMRDFDDYIEYVRCDSTGDELTNMLDALCTNLTRFFREHQHFDYLAQQVIGRKTAKAGSSAGELRIWSAGCASGEEAYSIAITVAENMPEAVFWDVGILATDLSSSAIETAQQGVYDQARLKTVPPQWRARYFQAVQDRPHRIYRVNDALRRMMHFARLNLISPWPMRGQFDVIFCRNVMIYFNKKTQAELINRFWRVLKPGGVLCIGHSESLAGVRHKFSYVQPTIYERP